MNLYYKLKNLLETYISEEYLTSRYMDIRVRKNIMKNFIRIKDYIGLLSVNFLLVITNDYLYPLGIHSRFY